MNLAYSSVLSEPLPCPPLEGVAGGEPAKAAGVASSLSLPGVSQSQDSHRRGQRTLAASVASSHLVSSHRWGRAGSKEAGPARSCLGNEP